MAAVSEGPNHPLSFPSMPSLELRNHSRLKRRKSDSHPSHLRSDSGASLGPIAAGSAALRPKTCQPPPFVRDSLPPPTRASCKKSMTRDSRKQPARKDGKWNRGEEEEEEEDEEEEGEFRPDVSPPEMRPKSLRLRGLAPALGGDEKKKLEIPKFSVSLTREEIEEDVWALTGFRPSRRPKKRARNIQNKLDQTFPGLWLPNVTADRYRIAEQ